MDNLYSCMAASSAVIRAARLAAQLKPPHRQASEVGSFDEICDASCAFAQYQVPQPKRRISDTIVDNKRLGRHDNVRRLSILDEDTHHFNASQCFPVEIPEEIENWASAHASERVWVDPSAL